MLIDLRPIFILGIHFATSDYSVVELVKSPGYHFTDDDYKKVGEVPAECDLDLNPLEIGSLFD
jgi:hypothetical protein